MCTILDSTSILLPTVPLALPIAQALGLDLVWLGMVTIVAVEIGLLTPPFALAMLLALVLLVAFPALVTAPP